MYFCLSASRRTSQSRRRTRPARCAAEDRVVVARRRFVYEQVVRLAGG